MSKPAGTTSIAVGSARLYRSGLLVHLTLLLLSNEPAASQEPVDIYRFILGIDVPEPTALVALGSAPLHVLRGSAPKPLSATIVASPLPASGRSVSAGLDFSPYFMAGGGKRPLASYRSNTFAGRLLRVLTKTMVSIGMARANDSASRVSLGFRSTIHDPHDPVLNSDLPERVADALARAGVSTVSEDEDVTALGADLRPAFGRARRQMRGRSGDAQISLGYGAAWRARGGSITADSLTDVRHTVFATAQYTPGPRYDLLATVQVRDAFGDASDYWLGAGVLRKIGASDLLVELYYATRPGRLHAGVGLDFRLLPQAAVGVSASSRSETDPLLPGSLYSIDLRISGKVFIASDD